MTTSRFTHRVLLAGALVLALSAAGRAQTAGPSRPYRGLFAPDAGGPDRGQALNLTVDVLGAYDDDLGAASLGQAPDPRLGLAGMYSTGSATLHYLNRGDHGAFDVTGGTIGRYYPDTHGLNSSSEWAAASLSRDLTGRTHLSLTGSASYEPYYLLDSFAPSRTAVAAGSNLDYAVLWRPALSYAGSVTLAHDLTRRASVELLYALHRTDSMNDSATLQDHAVGGRVLYRMTSHATLHAGYVRQDLSNRLVTAYPTIVNHQIDAGVDYARALSISRRLSFGFSTTSALVSVSSPTAPTTTRFSLLGSAFLNQDLGQSWYARLTYQRSLEMLEITAQPFFVDSVVASTGGYLGPRVDLRWTGGYSNASLVAGGHGFVTYDASVRGRVALVSDLAVYVEYLYYHYDFATAVPIPDRLVRAIDRQGVRVGLTWWLPIVH